MKDEYKLNAARCLICDSVVVATEAGELNKCKCGNLTVTGNRNSNGLIRYIKQIDYYQKQYEELSLYSTGHKAAPSHAIIKPLSSLDDVIPGKCFIQYHLHSRRGGWRMLDERGQELQVVEVVVSKDRLYSTSVRFRFRPVAGINFYQCGELTEKAFDFFRYIQDEVIPDFLKTGRTRAELILILKDNGFQDRTGMRDNGGEWRICGEKIDELGCNE